MKGALNIAEGIINIAGQLAAWHMLLADRFRRFKRPLAPRGSSIARRGDYLRMVRRYASAGDEAESLSD